MEFSIQFHQCFVRPINPVFFYSWYSKNTMNRSKPEKQTGEKNNHQIQCACDFFVFYFFTNDDPPTLLLSSQTKAKLCTVYMKRIFFRWWSRMIIHWVRHFCFYYHQQQQWQKKNFLGKFSSFFFKKKITVYFNQYSYTHRLMNFPNLQMTSW